MIDNIHKDIQPKFIKEYNQELLDMTAQEIIIWGYKKFDKHV